MTEPTFDRDGYPTDETLATIKAWQGNYGRLLQYVRGAWHYPNFVIDNLDEHERHILRAEPGDRFIRFVTGGWSGNESLIGALEGNTAAYVLTWRMSARGGLHIFQVPKWETPPEGKP